MTPVSPSPSTRSQTRLNRLLLILIALCLALQLHMQFAQKINWDEFFFLSFIYEQDKGTLSKVLQTFHVHFFGWLKAIPGNEIRQIEIARSLMWLVQIVTLANIYLLGRLVISRTGALAAVLFYVSTGFIFTHGTSFRADPIAACLILSAATLLARSKLSPAAIIGFGLTAGLATLITVKTVLFAPLFMSLGLYRLFIAGPSQARTSTLIRIALMPIAALIIFALGYIWHESQLAAEDLSMSTARMENAANTVFMSGLFPRLGEIIMFAFGGIVQAGFLIFGVVILAWRAARKSSADTPHNLWLLGAFLSPLLCLIFYRNAFPYFFAYIMPTAMIVAAYGLERLRSDRGIQAIFIIMAAFNALWIYKVRWVEPQTPQLETVTAFHAIFPNGADYIDRCSMISSQTKHGQFMSSWGMQNYRQTHVPIYGDILGTHTIPALILNSPHIMNAVLPGSHPEPTALLQEDIITLRESYIPHWGHIWVAGKQLSLTSESQNFELNIPGTYRVETQASVTLNGDTLTPGSIIHLNRGTHTLSSQTPQDFTLRWAQATMPEGEPSALPIFTGF